MEGQVNDGGINGVTDQVIDRSNDKVIDRAINGVVNDLIDESFLLSTDSIDSYTHTSSWTCPTLYKTDTRGMLWILRIFFDGKNLYSVNGIIRTSKGVEKEIEPVKIDVTLNKSGREMDKQALLEARSRYREAHRKNGYRTKNDVGTDMENTTEDPTPQQRTYLKPMCANVWVTIEILLNHLFEDDF